MQDPSNQELPEITDALNVNVVKAVPEIKPMPSFTLMQGGPRATATQPAAQPQWTSQDDRRNAVRGFIELIEKGWDPSGTGLGNKID